MFACAANGGKITCYERIFLKALRKRAGHSDVQNIVTGLSELLDLVLHAEKPNDLRPVDMFNSAYFPTLAKLGFATRHLTYPFHICHLIERRKALALIICALEDTSDAFGFERSVPPLRGVRELMSQKTYDRFERHILDVAKHALPV